MISVQEARKALLNQTHPLPPTEQCALKVALNRVISEDIASPINVPLFNNAQMDGYALRYKDWHANKCFTVSQTVAAGGGVPPALAKDSAARIFTGAMLPEGADCIIMQEHANRQGNTVQFPDPPVQGQFVRHAAEVVQKGQTVLNKGQHIGSAEIALLAHIGYDKVPTYQPITIAIIGSGDELVQAGDRILESAQIYDSNTPMIASILKSWGCTVETFHLKDDLKQTEQVLSMLSKEFTIIISTGGVSVGERDYLRPAIEKLGHVQEWKVKMRPGKPVIWAKLGSSIYIGLPGNPVSAFVSLHVIAQPFIKSCQGRYTSLEMDGYALADFKHKADNRAQFLRVQVQHTPQGCILKKYPNQESHAITGLSWATALAYVGDNQEVSHGETLPFLWLRNT